MNSSFVIFPLSTSALSFSLFSKASLYSSNTLTFRAANASSSSVLSNSFSRFAHLIAPRYWHSYINRKLRWLLKPDERSMYSHIAPEACNYLTRLESSLSLCPGIFASSSSKIYMKISRYLKY
jgi:hypothetical protein